MTDLLTIVRQARELGPKETEAPLEPRDGGACAFQYLVRRVGGTRAGGAGERGARRGARRGAAAAGVAAAPSARLARARGASVHHHPTTTTHHLNVPTPKIPKRRRHSHLSGRRTQDTSVLR
eukprot:scaffold9331_cov116-Isochrysis_galbana.AAC.12